MDDEGNYMECDSPSRVILALKGLAHWFVFVLGELWTDVMKDFITEIEVKHVFDQYKVCSVHFLCAGVQQ